MDDGGDTSSKNDVIPATTSKKPLPDTGGVPLFAAIVFGLILAGAVLSISADQHFSPQAADSRSSTSDGLRARTARAEGDQPVSQIQ